MRAGELSLSFKGCSTWEGKPWLGNTVELVLEVWVWVNCEDMRAEEQLTLPLLMVTLDGLASAVLESSP